MSAPTQYEYRGARSGGELVIATRVTAVTSLFPKPAIPRWAAKLVAETAWEHREWLAKAKPEQEQAAIDRLKARPWEARDEAADLGSSIHDAIEKWQKVGMLPDYPLPIRAQMGHFGEFLSAFEPDFLMAEARVWNLTYRYAGTLDAIVRLGDKRYVLDIKTGKGVYPDHALQLAAYRHAEFALIGSQEHDLPPTDGALILHIRPEGWRLLEVDADQAAFDTFLALCELNEWMQGPGKREPALVQGVAQDNETAADAAWDASKQGATA